MFNEIKPVFSFLTRQRADPWNWLIQTCGMVFLLIGLYARSSALIVLGGGFIAGGTFHLPLPPMEYTGLHRLDRAIRRINWAEREFFSPPMTRTKGCWIAFWLAYLVGWGVVVWVQDLGLALLLAVILFFIKLYRDNRSSGIQ